MADLGSLTARALTAALWISLPLLGVALVAALGLGALQVVTRTQESALSSLGRALIVGGALCVLSPWLYAQLVGLTTTLYQLLPGFAR